MSDFHSRSAAALPAISTASLLELALDRLDQGAIDLGALDRAYRSVSADTLARQLIATCPDETSQVVPLLERDPLDHVSFDGATVTSDCAPARAGDRYVDLGPLAGRLARLVGPEALPVFFDSYGLSAPEPRRLDFFLLLGGVLSAPHDAVL